MSEVVAEGVGGGKIFFLAGEVVPFYEGSKLEGLVFGDEVEGKEVFEGMEVV